MPEELKARGIWAEHYIRDFLSLPFISEFVFHSLQTLKKGIQKEVADFLIAYPGVGVLISQKTQKDVHARTADETASWALKESKKAVSQLCGALRTARDKLVWCEHQRRGRVEMPDGLPAITHGIVILEVLDRVDLNPQAADLPLIYQDTPITYLSVNEFLNIAIELRTVPELLAYLDARRVLPETDLRSIGDEIALFECYLLNNGSLAGCATKAEAAMSVAERRDELDRALHTKWENDQDGGLIEDVADQLATRRQDYADGLSPEALARYDALENRTNYLRMQAALANLGLRQRSELGRAFKLTIDKQADSGNDFTYMAMHIDGMPEWVYVLGSCAGIEPEELAQRKQILMMAALAHYRKTHCLQIIDREKASYEVGLMIRPEPPSSAMQRALGDRFFGQLKMTDRELALIPG
jgi:hypothetical protein